MTFDLVHHGYNCCFGHLRNCEAGRLDFLRSQAVAGDIDDIVYPAQNAEVSIGSQYGTVSGKVRPVTPRLTRGVLAVLRVVFLDEAVGVAPDGLHDSGPRISDADVSGNSRAGGNILPILIVDDRVDPGHARTSASRLHGIQSWLGTAEETTVLGLPPRINNDGLALAYDIVVPLPDRWFYRLSDRRHVLEMIVVFLRLFRTSLPQHADRGRRGVKDVDG